eukprot:2886792-Pyramimonas_sp.AAC.1
MAFGHTTGQPLGLDTSPKSRPHCGYGDVSERFAGSCPPDFLRAVVRCSPRYSRRGTGAPQRGAAR